MFFKELIPYKKLNSYKDDLCKRYTFFNWGVFFIWIIGMLFMCIIIMSLMIVKVSSTAAFYQNQTEALRTRNIQSYNPASIDTSTTPAPLEAITSYEQQHQRQEEEENQILPTNFTQPKTQPLKPPKYKKYQPSAVEMRAETHEQLQPHAQQHHLQQQQQQQQQHQQHHHQQYLQQYYQPPQQDQLHAIAGETSYLLERADERQTAHEQPIYGTWRTKARRPQPPLPASTSAAASPPGSNGRRHGDNAEPRQQHQHQHFYERLPKRSSSTVTPLKSDLHDQIPRPPRLTSRRPSLLVRREYMETPINNSFGPHEQKPKPFHFPHDGPLPQEFKKAEAERAEVNNIQDILQQLQLGGGGVNGGKVVPQLMMMPTGLHIAGSFKNLKSSGIANFFRNKRHKKQLQVAFPMQLPMQLLSGGYAAPPMFNAIAQPYQRIAMDQFYPFKPRSPNDINLLAMQQQQLKAGRSKGKKKKQQKSLANNNLMLQHSNQRPYTADPFMQSYPPFFDATQNPKLKRVPFKVNLDIFPIMPPTKDYRTSAFTLEEARVQSSRPPTVLRNPFMEYYPFQMLPSAAALSYTKPHEAQQPVYSPFKFPSSPPPTSSGNHIAFPDQFSPQQQLQKSPQFLHAASNHPQAQYHHNADTARPGSPASNTKNNQIMVHLNVFPKHRAPSSSTAAPSTNPFYNNALNINRKITPDDSAIEPRQQPRALNLTSSPPPPSQPVSRSDHVDMQPLVDFEHPIVAAEIPENPHAAALISNKLDSPNVGPHHYDQIEGRHSNFHFNASANVEQLASEAKTASLFRFPVEDLIQFQVDDAL